MKMRWKKAEIVKFIRIYEKYECLWDYDHPAYRDLELKTKAYCDIIDEFKAVTSISLSIPECKLKVKNLRSTYLNQLKLLKRRSKSDASYVPRLAWFYEMDRFLKRIPIYSRDTQETSSDVDSSAWPDDDHGTRRNPLSGSEDDSSHEGTNIKQELSPLPQPYKKNKKKKCKLRSWTSEPVRITEAVRTTEAIRTVESPGRGPMEDEFDIYGKYIASQLRSMDLQKALKVQLKIQSLMSEARISDMDSSE